MPRFLKRSNGGWAEESTVTVSAGAVSAGRVPQLNGSGYLDPTFLNAAQTGNNKVLQLNGSGKLSASLFDTTYDYANVLAGETLGAGQFVNVGATARLAGGARGLPAHGYVMAGFTSGTQARIYFSGTNNLVSGAVPGEVYLSPTTLGGFTSTMPTTTGQICQMIGVAWSTTSIKFLYLWPATRG